MSEARYTPGPWRIASDAQGPCMVLHPTLDGVAIANCDDAFVPANGYHTPKVSEPEPCADANMGTTYYPERVANVRLIAAAPDMLAALHVALAYMNTQFGGVREDAIVRAAIAKATTG
jgi:hypothetical protein